MLMIESAVQMPALTHTIETDLDQHWSWLYVVGSGGDGAATYLQWVGRRRREPPGKSQSCTWL